MTALALPRNKKLIWWTVRQITFSCTIRVMAALKGVGFRGVGLREEVGPVSSTSDSGNAGSDSFSTSVYNPSHQDYDGQG